MPSVLTRGMLYWLRAPKNFAAARRQEWIITIARVLVSICSLIAVRWFHAGSSNNIEVYALHVYLIFSLAIPLTLRANPQLSPFFYIVIHVMDILWAVNLIALVNWPGLSFALFLFIMTATAFRWGFWEAQLTNFVFAIFLVISCGAYKRDIFLLWHHHESMEFIPEILLFVVVSILVGLLAEAKAVNSETNTIGRILDRLRVESGIEAASRILCAEGLRLFGATQFLLAVLEKSSGKASLFRMTGAHPELEASELDSMSQANYFFPAPGASWRIAARKRNGMPQFQCATLTAGKLKKTTGADCSAFGAFCKAHPYRLLLATAPDIGEEWSLRAFAVDPRKYFGGYAGLRFLDSSGQQAAALMRSIFVTGRMKTRTKAKIQSQVARELHDGVIQTLCNINLQLEDLREKAGLVIAEDLKALDRIQQSVLEEIASLRDFTLQLRTFEIDSSRFLGFLSGMAVKFQGEHGISARFVTDLTEVRLQPNVCTELARIAQEALANARKHSGATEVLMRFSRRNGFGVLAVIDNGCGFGFSGRREHEELQASGNVPAVIMERAQIINGKVSIECVEGKGAWLEVAFPYE